MPAHNEARLIGATLDAIHAAGRAAGEPYEIIVSNDASTDDTAAIAGQHGARVVTVEHRKIGATRNSGAAQAQGDLLIFVDADTLLTADVVRAAVDAVRAGAIGGSAKASFDGHVPRYARVLVWLWLRMQQVGRLAAGCFIFCARDAFVAAGGFDERLYAAEDVALSLRLRRLGRFVILPDTVITSGRNARAHSGYEMWRMLGGVVRYGPAFLKRREGLRWWYGGRRDDSDPSS